jgi:hypothetical protein
MDTGGVQIGVYCKGESWDSRTKAQQIQKFGKARLNAPIVPKIAQESTTTDCPLKAQVGARFKSRIGDGQQPGWLNRNSSSLLFGVNSSITSIRFGNCASKLSALFAQSTSGFYQRRTESGADNQNKCS